MSYLCRERYRLELHWNKIQQLSDNVVVLDGAYFSGPVLTDAVKLEPSDFIDLDLTPQMLALVESYYLVRLSWESVEYCADGTIALGKALLKNDHLKTIHKLKDDDYVIINTEKHEESTHAYHLVYDSQVMRGDKNPHNYRSK